MFQHILVPLDGSSCAERALPVAACIARATHGSILLARALPVSIEASWYSMGAPLLMEEALDLELDEAERYLAGVARRSELAGIETKTEMLASTPVQSILATSSKQQIDLIVMCSHGTAGFKRWLSGSVTQNVMRHSPIPVLALREKSNISACSYPDTTRPLHTFTTVVALDGSPRAEEALLPAATLTAAIAAPARGGLHLTQVVKVPADSNKHGIDQTMREQALYEAKYYLRETANHLFEGPVADLDLTITWSVAMGESVAKALVRVAEHGEDARGVRVFGGYDMLAMATHGRSGIERWVLGSVAEQLLTTTTLPMFVVHSSQPAVQPTPQIGTATVEQPLTWAGLL